MIVKLSRIGRHVAKIIHIVLATVRRIPEATAAARARARALSLEGFYGIKLRNIGLYKLLHSIVHLLIS